MNHKTKDILERIEDSSPNESSHEMFCRLRDCAHEIETLRAALASRSDAQADARGAFQSRVHPWMLECFGSEIAADKIERNHRFFEEATEAVQANGMTRSEAHQLVDYTFDRPVGELHQEIGGVMVTLAALCLASGQDMHAAGETELARIWTKVEQIRAKQAAKPKHSPLPEARAAAPAAAPSEPTLSEPKLAVWYGPMPESNGKTNWTVILHNGDVTKGITIEQSEYPDRVRYEADRLRWIIGDLNDEPCALDYDADQHSGYVAQQPQAAEPSEPSSSCDPGDICAGCRCKYNTYGKQKLDAVDVRVSKGE